MTADPTTLNLNYVFTPQLVRASVDDNSTVITLRVLVSAPNPSVTVTEIRITIPAGFDAENTLTESKELPQPLFQGAIWSIRVDDDIVTIKPAPQTSGK